MNKKITKEEVLKKTIKIVDKLINFVMIVFFLLLMLIGVYAIYDSYRIYDDSRLGDEIIKLRPKIEDGFSIEPLREVNPDIDGWIRIFDTNIDYPILYSKDNMNYLNVSYNGSYSTGGSIFIDYRNARDFKDDYTITYGHNMTTGQMYSDIKRYEEKRYFDNHLSGILYTADGLYKVKILYFSLMNAYNDDAYNLLTYRNERNGEILEMFEKRAFNENSDFDGSADKLLLLSTCDAFGSNDRSALLAELIKIDDEEMREIEEGSSILLDGGKGDGGENDVEKAGKRLGCFFIIILIIIIIIVVVRKIREKRREQKERKKQV